MNFQSTALPGVILVEPAVYRDERGFFLETYQAERYAAGGIATPFVQDNHSRSVARTLRGLHAQLTRPQGKLVRCVEGAILDVAVDIRRGSPTFGRWVGYELTSENFHQLYVPPGFAHGFAVLSNIAQVEYKCTDFYFAADEISLAWNEPAFGIDWQVKEPILSKRDQAALSLEAALERLPRWP